MSRIVALDYGQKRTGIAITDPLQMIASPLTTVETKDLVPFLDKYFKEEEVEKVVIGYPTNLDNTPTDNTARVEKFISRFRRIFPDKEIIPHDEYGTSQEAKFSMVASGMRASQRREKGNLDKISAAIILQQYLAENS